MKEDLIQKETTNLVNFFWDNSLPKEEYIYHVSAHLRYLISEISDNAVRNYRESVEKANARLRLKRKRFVENSIEEVEDYLYNQNKSK